MYISYYRIHIVISLVMYKKYARQDCITCVNLSTDLLSYLDRFLARCLCLVVLSLLVLLAALGKVGVVGQAAEKR